MKDNFSTQSDSYSKYRPGYPLELFDYILKQVKHPTLAWDCATGNGQAAKELSRHFDEVYATDISEKQLNNAVQAPNIIYKKETAEKTLLADASVDLITVAQALHWFDFDLFYAEVKRVSKPGGIIAVWTYSLLSINPEIDALINEYHFNTLKKYWDAERAYVDDGYSTIPFPFKQIGDPGFEIKLRWTIEEPEGYFYTWSAAQKYLVQNGYSPVPELMAEIKKSWPVSEVLPIRFPIYLKIGRVNEV